MYRELWKEKIDDLIDCVHNTNIYHVPVSFKFPACRCLQSEIATFLTNNYHPRPSHAHCTVAFEVGWFVTPMFVRQTNEGDLNVFSAFHCFVFAPLSPCYNECSIEKYFVFNFLHWACYLWYFWLFRFMCVLFSHCFDAFRIRCCAIWKRSNRAIITEPKWTNEIYNFMSGFLRLE